MANENRIENEADETALRDLFAAFDDVQASSELEDSTIAGILALAGATEPAEGSADASAEGSADASAGASTAASALASADAPAEGSADTPADAPAEQVPVAVLAMGSASQDSPAGQDGGHDTTGKAESAQSKRAAQRARRARIRVFRIAAAACLVFALTGGLAYATPTAYVQVGDGDTAVEIGVNMFGIAVSADSEDQEMKRLIDEAGLCNRPSGDSIERAFALFEEKGGEDVPNVTVRSDDAGQRARLQDEADKAFEEAEGRFEEKAAERVAERTAERAADEPRSDAGGSEVRGNEPQATGQPADKGQGSNEEKGNGNGNGGGGSQTKEADQPKAKETAQKQPQESQNQSAGSSQADGTQQDTAQKQDQQQSEKRPEGNQDQNNQQQGGQANPKQPQEPDRQDDKDAKAQPQSADSPAPNSAQSQPK